MTKRKLWKKFSSKMRRERKKTQAQVKTQQSQQHMDKRIMNVCAHLCPPAMEFRAPTTARRRHHVNVGFQAFSLHSNFTRMFPDCFFLILFCIYMRGWVAGSRLLLQIMCDVKSRKQQQQPKRRLTSRSKAKKDSSRATHIRDDIFIIVALFFFNFSGRRPEDVLQPHLAPFRRHETSHKFKKKFAEYIK